jgi:hypothetical protein
MTELADISRFGSPEKNAPEGAARHPPCRATDQIIGYEMIIGNSNGWSCIVREGYETVIVPVPYEQ